MIREPKILIYDIETSLQTVAVFQLAGNDWIQPHNIIQERHLISACWQWLGETKVHSVSLLDDPKRFAADPHDDKHVVTELYKALAASDLSVAHYGDSFDLKYLKTRALIHGLDPLPPAPTIDTKKICKQQFYFNSNSLDYVGKQLGLGGKINTPGGLWLTILNNGSNEKAVQAIKTMVTYNKRDVTLLRDVFLKLRGYMPNHLNRELFGNTGCPRCGSKKVQSRGTYYAQTRTYRRWQCMGDCKGWFRTLKADKDSGTASRVL
jgi:hypothetical protein